MKKLLLVLLISTTFILVTYNVIKCNNLVKDNILNSTIENFEVDEIPMVVVIQELNEEVKKLNIIITFEEAENSETETLISFKTKKSTLRNILNKIIKRNQKYSWKQYRNVINIIPSDRLNDRDYLLNKQMKEVSIINKNKQEIVDKVIGQINEENANRYTVKTEEGKTINKLIMNVLPYKDLEISPPLQAKHIFSVKNTNIREILNMISIEENIPWYIMLHKVLDDNMMILVFVETVKL